MVQWGNWIARNITDVEVEGSTPSWTTTSDQLIRLKNMDSVVILAFPATEADQLRIKIKSFTPPPDGSKQKCEGCGMECWIGKKQTGALHTLPHAMVLCVECALKDGYDPNAVHSLGGVGSQIELQK